LSTDFFYLIVASLFQVGWLYNIKRIRREKIAVFRFHKMFSKASLNALLPLIAYIILGLGNVFFLTLSMREIPASVVYGVWTGIVLALSSLIDRYIFRQKFSLLQYIFILMIFGGIAGLKSLNE
jgi:quaternary ammonium compound-resistance protein SugE